MNKTDIAAVLAALTFATSGNVLAAGKKETVPCVSESRMEKIIGEMPKYFKHPKLHPNNPKSHIYREYYYTIEGGLTVEAFPTLESGMTFYDSRLRESNKAYSVSNKQPSRREGKKDYPQGCVSDDTYKDGYGAYLIGKNWGETRPMSRDDAQRKFNAIIDRIEQLSK